MDSFVKRPGEILPGSNTRDAMSYELLLPRMNCQSLNWRTNWSSSIRGEIKVASRMLELVNLGGGLYWGCTCCMLMEHIGARSKDLTWLGSSTEEERPNATNWTLAELEGILDKTAERWRIDLNQRRDRRSRSEWLLWQQKVETRW
jgi:hypothetical protein